MMINENQSLIGIFHPPSRREPINKIFEKKISAAGLGVHLCVGLQGAGASPEDLRHGYLVL